MNRRSIVVLAALGSLVVALPLLLIVLVLGSQSSDECNVGGDSVEVSGTTSKAVGQWSAEQARNASVIVAVGAKLGVPARGQMIAVMTAIGESSLIVVDHGDVAGPDSRGLFQQRSAGWGSYEQRMDPAGSATSFYKALMGVQGWQAMDPSLAAHTVQRNADPHHYEKFWQPAQVLVQTLGTASATTQISAEGQSTGSAAAAAPQAAPPVMQTMSGADCSAGDSSDAGGAGFAVNGAVDHVGPYGQAQLAARAQKFVAAGASDPFYGSVVGGWYRKCQHFVANMSGRAFSGFGTANDAWAAFKATGAAHPAGAIDGHAPPPGAWLYYDTGSSAGHVAVYLGGGKVTGNDTWGNGRIGIGPASDLVDGKWHLTYLGWAAPWGQKVPAVAPKKASTGGTGSQQVSQTGGPIQVGAGQFIIGTLNWRGASHLHHDPHPGERSYATRVPGMVAKVQGSGASIIGFQEFESPQANAFLNATGGRWGLVTATKPGGRQKTDTRNAIAYDTTQWRVGTVQMVTILYAHGTKLNIPLVRFDSTGALGSVTVLNTHNPTTGAGIGGTPQSRDYDVALEAATLRQAAAQGVPSFLTGDMNARAPFITKFLSSAGQGWSSAVPTAQQIDWIMGSPTVRFTATRVDRSTNDGAHSFTDHPFVYAVATVRSAL